jgi:H+/gluconate symporter-like permease
MMYALRSLLIAGVVLVAAASVFGAGAAVAVADALFWLVGAAIRLISTVLGRLLDDSNNHK